MVKIFGFVQIYSHKVVMVRYSQRLSGSNVRSNIFLLQMKYRYRLANENCAKDFNYTNHLHKWHGRFVNFLDGSGAKSVDQTDTKKGERQSCPSTFLLSYIFSKRYLLAQDNSTLEVLLKISIIGSSSNLGNPISSFLNTSSLVCHLAICCRCC